MLLELQSCNYSVPRTLWQLFFVLYYNEFLIPLYDCVFEANVEFIEVRRISMTSLRNITYKCTKHCHTSIIVWQSCVFVILIWEALGG